MTRTLRGVLCLVAALYAGLAGATDNTGARFGPTQGLINTGARPDTLISVGGTLTYTQGTGLFVLDTPVASTLFGPPISANLDHFPVGAPPNKLLVSIHIDNATATTVTSGPNAYDLILTGTVGPWSGTLLRGTILKFAYDSDGFPQRFQLLFRVEPGGLLSEPAPGGGGYYAGQYIGLIVNAESTTLPDGGDFTADWVATAAPKGNLFPACEGTLGDFVWHDQDGDGVQDPPEPGIDNVDLTLTGIDAYGQQIGIPGCAPPPPAGWNAGLSHCFPARMETTAPYQGLHGYYQFGGLCRTPSPLNGNPGYTVAATPPPAPLSTPTLTGVGSTALDSNPNPSTLIQLTSSPGGLPPMNPTIDFGFVSNCTGKIGNLVWLDLNGNGIQDNINGVGGEPGLNDVKVELFLSPDLVNPIATQWTINGYYEFTGLCAGQYAVDVDDAPFAGLYTPTLSDATTDDLDSDPLPFYSVTLPANDSVDLDADFGYVSACALEVGNFAWYDANFNGQQDGGEIGLSNVLITLTYCPNGAPCPGSGNEIVLTQLTDAVGAYKFQGLCAGTYSIKAENPGLQYFPTTSAPHVFPPAVSTNSNNPAPFQFTLGPNSDLNFDYGYMSPCDRSLGDYMWYDLVRDGLHDAAQLVEPGINGLIIELHRASDHLLIDTEITYTGLFPPQVMPHPGFYRFAGLGYNPATGACVTPPTPTFTVRAFTPLTPTLSFQGGDPALDSNGNPTNTISLPAVPTHDPKVDIGFLPIDLELMKSVDNSTPVVGTNVVFTLTITNNNAPPGVSTATGVKVKDVLPAGLTFVSANPAAEYDSASGVWDVGTLAPGASKVLTITATVTTAGVKINYAQVITAGEPDVDSTPNNNPNGPPSEDDEAQVPLTPNADANLKIHKTDGVPTYVPGLSTTYTIVVTNSGPAGVVNASVTDTKPGFVTSWTWVCGVPTGGASGCTGQAASALNFSDLVDMPAGSTITYIVTASIAPNAVGALVNTATVTPPPESPNPGTDCQASGGTYNPATGSCSSTDIDTPIRQAELKIHKTDGVPNYVPGTSTTYTVVVTNSGPSNVTNVSVTDTKPGFVTSWTWVCAPAATGGATGCTGQAASAANFADVVDMPAGSTISYTVTASIAADAVGDLVNTATVTPPPGTTNPGTDCQASGATYNPMTGSCSSTDIDTPTPQANLKITKTDGVLLYVPGTSTTYTIVVTNSGPSNVLNAQVTDIKPGFVTSWTWVCAPAATGGASGCTGQAASAANFSDFVDMPAGSTISYTVTADIAANAVGPLVNTATVTPPPGTTNPGTDCQASGGTYNPATGSCSSTDTDNPNPQVNLKITKTDGVPSYVPGTSTTYTIVVSNSGPSNALGVQVTDTKPGFVTSWTWVCAPAATGGASGCTGQAASAANFSDFVDMPAGSTISYTVTASIAANAVGNLVNTAVVTPPPGTTNPGTDCVASGGTFNPATGTCSSTDTDTPTPQANLKITKTDGVLVYVPGLSTTYTIVVTNSGPSNVANVQVTDTKPGFVTSWTWVCAPAATGGATGCTGQAASAANFSDFVDMPAGSTISYTVTASIAANAVGPLVNTATVTPPPGTTNPGTDCQASGGSYNPATGACSSTDTDNPNPQANLKITKTDGVPTYTPNTSTTYTIVVSNSGPSGVLNVQVTDTKPAFVTSWTWVCAPAATGGGAGCSGQALSAANFSDFVDLPAGSTISYTVTANIAANAVGNLVNTAVVTPPPGTTNPGTDCVASGGTFNPATGTCSSTDTDTPVVFASLGDRVWLDVDGDGVQDGGEGGVGGVTVNLFTCAGVASGTTVTNGSGNYLFSNLSAGQYYVQFVKPAGMVFTLKLAQGADAGFTNNNDSNADQLTGKTDCVTLVAGQNNLTLDAGLVPGQTFCPPSGAPANFPKPMATMFVMQDANFVYVQYDQSTGLNDNSYGVNAVGWSSHSFSQLVGSDQATFDVYNGNNTKVLSFAEDTISLASDCTAPHNTPTPSNYKSCGAFGKEGKCLLGNCATAIASYTTAIAENLNSLGYCAAGVCNPSGTNLLVDSPDVNPNTTYNLANPAHYPNGWNFVNSFTFKLNKTFFGAAGFGKVLPVSQHNSPQKVSGSYVPQPCPVLTLACPTGGTTGQVTVPYNKSLVVTNGVAPYTFSIIGGSLPPGLTLNTTTGAITGTPTLAGAYPYTAKVVDSTGAMSTVGCTITISQAPPLALACPVATGNPGASYSSAFVATGGTPPYTNYSIILGALPPGLMLNAATGFITGTLPATPATYNFTGQVTDSTPGNATKACSITVASPLPIAACKNLKPINVIVLKAPAAGVANVKWYKGTSMTPANLLGESGPIAGNAVFNFGGYSGASNDNNFDVTLADGVTHVTSQFHLSCSDNDMNDSADCGKLAGNGKDNTLPAGNIWKFIDFIGPFGSASQKHLMNCSVP